MTLRLLPRSPRAILLGTAVAVALGGIGALMWQVGRDFRLLRTATSDNVQWTLSRAEVEAVDFSREIDRARAAAAPDLAALRRRFDVLYSRVAVLSQGDVYGPLAESPDTAEALAAAQAAMDRAVALIDAPDAELAAGLDALASGIEPLRAALRDYAVAGITHFAAEGDAHRADLLRTLLSLAAVTAALVAALGVTALWLDRTARRSQRRRDELQATSARLSAVIEAALDAVVVTDRDGTILEFNGAAEAIFGHRRADVLGRRIGEVIVPAHLRPLHDAGMRRMAEGGERHVVGHGRVRLEGLRASGEIFPVELAIQAAGAGASEMLVAFLRDITAEVAAERELIEARDRALAGERAKAEFLAVMSHEIRTPLNGLLGNLALLQGSEGDARTRELVRRMDLSGRLLLTHVNGVLEVARHDAGRVVAAREPADIEAMLADLVDAHRAEAAAAGTTLDWQWQGTPWRWLATDRPRLEQLLVNLVGNAIKFTPEGHVRLVAEVRAVAGGGLELGLEVVDTGIGIAEADLDRIFEDFVTGDASFGRRRGGTGLGLGIARRLAAALGGRIAVESRPGEGSTFRVAVPVEAAQPPAPEPEAEAAPAPVAPRRVLVVEDNEINRLVVREMLRRDGHAVVEADNGRDAVALAARERFDLVLMDISMPVMDGLEAARAIRDGGGASAGRPILAFTASVLPADAERVRAARMDGVLAKPVTLGALRAALASVDVGSAAAVAEVVVGAGPSRPAIDPLVAQETRELVGEKVFARFVARLEGELDAFFAQAPGAEVAGACHKLASSAATFGATDLRAALRAAEAAAGGPGEAAALDAAAAEWRRARPALRALVAA